MILLWTTALAAPQDTAANRDKYWDLRDRLTSEFLATGTDPGASIPAVHRNDVLDYIKWADGTAQLGWYLAVLATEHRLLTGSRWHRYDAGRVDAIDATRTELHDALQALERLDQVGELGYPCLGTGSLNGFFVRDDVPAGFDTRFAGVGNTLSDSTDLAVYNKEMSQDQVYHLFLGLAAVRRFVPPGTLVSGKDLNAWAVTLGQRIATKVATTDAWVIQNPACNKDVDRGADARAYSGGTVQAFATVTGGTYTVSGLNAWGLMGNPNNPAYLNPDNLHMTLVIGAVGEGWGTNSLDTLMNLSALHDWYAYPLAYAALHDPTVSPNWATHQATLQGYAVDALTELPAGKEPRSPRPAGPAAHGWTSWNRYLRDKSDHYAGASGTDGQRYHGLDYLLLHNLLYLAVPTAWDLAPPDAADTDTDTDVIDTDSVDDPAAEEDAQDKPAVSGSGCGCVEAPVATGWSLLWRR